MLPEPKNILGTMPVGRLVLHMSWPIMISMLVQAVYNLVDSIFVARISDKAFLALSYAYPIQMHSAASSGRWCGGQRPLSAGSGRAN